MIGVVASNLWKKAHLNTDRYDVNKSNDTAFIGSLIGYQTKAGILKVNAETNRMLKEDMYTITAYTYKSINNYMNASSKSSFYSFKLIDEIGNINNLVAVGEETEIGIAFSTVGADNYYIAKDNTYIIGSGFSKGNINIYSGNWSHLKT